MHLLIPHASSVSEAASAVLRDLALPRLGRLLAQLEPTTRDDGDAFSYSTPHERALAAAWGWPVVDGCLPWAAHAAAADGIAVGDAAWALVTPTHWHVGRDHVSLADPAALHLSDDESRQALDAVRDLFETEGIRLEWGAADRWYAAHESFADLSTASLDRVIGRNVELWMRPAANPGARLIRRLQSEVQLLLYPHPINEAREAAGALTLNSFWLSGCGRALPQATGAVQVDDRLRAPLLADDWAGWAEAWARLDAEAVEPLLARLARGEPVRLSLCGERSVQRFDTVAQSVWTRLSRRWSGTAPSTWLEAL